MSKNILITGGTRGIGRAIALQFAKQKSNIAILAKTLLPHPKLEGTLESVSLEISDAGGKAYPYQVDVRNEESITDAVNIFCAEIGHIDILIHNASAISLTSTEKTSIKTYDLMMDVNVRGSFFTTQACFPALKMSQNAHIITLSPPLNLQPKWFESHVAYTISKFNMSMLTLGWSEEFRPYGIKANAIWPKTLIESAAIRNLPNGDVLIKHTRTPQIIAEAIFEMTQETDAIFSGNFLIDEDYLRTKGFNDFGKYQTHPENVPMIDLFLD